MKTGADISLHLEDLCIGYRHKDPVFRNISVKLKGGTLSGLVANNGMGKSTLLKTIAGALQPLSGSIKLNESLLHRLPLKEIAKRVSIVLTEKPQLPGLTVFDAVSMGRYPYTNIFGSLSEKDTEVIDTCIRMCGIQDLQNKNCLELSDGEFQKVMIARALAQQTEVLLLDEPTAFLDFTSKRKLFELLREIAETENKIILVSSHDLHTLLAHAHGLVVLRPGNVCEYLETEEVGDVEKLFL
ncbi:MAG: Iron-chelate-transporting ATPase [Bacteroidetes bacterium]|nr:Iron-chelate-transporting ATPase [Bacteroidota bacterium]